MRKHFLATLVPLPLWTHEKIAGDEERRARVTGADRFANHLACLGMLP
jgi:hypothetical protein